MNIQPKHLGFRKYSKHSTTVNLIPKLCSLYLPVLSYTYFDLIKSMLKVPNIHVFCDGNVYACVAFILTPTRCSCYIDWIN
jgi:hypothetical protein